MIVALPIIFYFMHGLHVHNLYLYVSLCHMLISIPIFFKDTANGYIILSFASYISLLLGMLMIKPKNVFKYKKTFLKNNRNMMLVIFTSVMVWFFKYQLPGTLYFICVIFAQVLFVLSFVGQNKDFNLLRILAFIVVLLISFDIGKVFILRFVILLL